MSVKVILMLIITIMLVLVLLLGILIMVKQRKRTQNATRPGRGGPGKQVSKTSNRRVTFARLVSTIHFDPAAPSSVRFKGISVLFEPRRSSRNRCPKQICVCGCNNGSSTEDGRSKHEESTGDKGGTGVSKTKKGKK